MTADYQSDSNPALDFLGLIVTVVLAVFAYKAYVVARDWYQDQVERRVYNGAGVTVAADYDYGLKEHDQVVFASYAVHESTHSDKHVEIDTIRKCLRENGPYMVYKARGRDTWYLVCKISDFFFAFQAVTKDGFEKTGYTVGDQSWPTIRNYLERFCTRFKQPLPWLSNLMK